jgi:hypothetical protein
MKWREYMFNSTCYIVFFFSYFEHINSIFVESNDVKKKNKQIRLLCFVHRILFGVFSHQFKPF